MQKSLTMETTNEKQPVKRKIENYDIAKADETLLLAADLTRFIKENRLFHNIQGKDYVNVEGWQYAGSRLGILPIVEEVTNLSEAGEVKYMAKVKLLNLKTEQTIGSGFAICSNKEIGKKSYQEYAIASMAQTRAIGKAYRNILAWIIRAAGYEPTPAEEMDFLGNSELANEKKTYSKNNINFEVKSRDSDDEKFKVSEPVAVQNLKVESLSEIENPATPKQKGEILLLLNNPVFKEDEKTKLVIQINTIDEEKAEKIISKLKKLIVERNQSANGKIAA